MNATTALMKSGSPSTTSRIGIFALGASFALVAALHPLLAGAQPSGSNGMKPAAEEPLKMSPFEVSVDQDVGYQAGNTTSGSRLNTSLKDTPAAIMVVTKEFMEDFGLNSLAEISAYTPNLSIDFRETVPDANPGFLAGADRETRIVVRGLPASAAMDFFKSTFPIDSYNIERFELASGPNSILFGTGSPGGLVNVATKTAKVDRNNTSLRFKFGSWELQRYELDHNQVLVKGKLAFRLNGLFEDANGWRTNMFRTVERGAASVRFKPWKRTTIIANGEMGRIEEHVASPWGSIDDQVKLWEESGSRVTNDTVWTTADRARGINRLTSIQTRYVTNADGSAPYFIPTRNAVDGRLLVTTLDDFNTPAVDRAGRTLVHPDVLPMKHSLYGPASKRYFDFDRVMINVDQELTENVTLNLAYDKENSYGESQKSLGAQFYLQGDPNLTIPNQNGVGPAIPNPNAGKLFVESQWNPFWGDVEQEGFRASLSAKFDFGKLGTHRLAGMYENSFNRSWAVQGRVIFVDNNNVPINNAVVENAANWIVQRHYVTPGNFSTYDAPDGLTPLTITRNGVTYHSRTIIQGLGPNDIEESIDTGMLVTQSNFFKDRLVVTGGIRRDWIGYDLYGNARHTATDPEVVSGERIVGELDYTDQIAERLSYRTDTFTLGGVYHVTPKFSVFYNMANNNAAPSRNSIILPDKKLPPPTDGETADYGFMMHLLDGKFFLRATAYKTSEKNKANAILLQDLRAPVLGILDTLLVNRLITDDQRTEHHLSETSPPIIRGLNDEVNTGYELSAWYNPSKNFTAQFNFSYTKTDRANIAPEFEGWFERERAFWYSFPGAGSQTDPATGTTIDQNVAVMPRVIQRERDLNQFGWGIRPYKANVSGRYSFSEGRLKGVFVGGGARWQSGSPIARRQLGTGADGRIIYGDTITGAEMFTVDGFVGYRTRFGIAGRNSNVSVQVNVTNLTDEGDWWTSRYNDNLTGVRFIQPITPRQFSLTVGLNF